MAALIFSLLQQFLVECGPLITYHSQPWTSHRSTPAGTRGGLSGAAPTTRSTPSAPGIPTAPRPTSLCSHQGPKQGEKTAEWMGEEKTAMRPQERCSHPITAGSFQQTHVLARGIQPPCLNLLPTACTKDAQVCTPHCSSSATCRWGLMLPSDPLQIVGSRRQSFYSAIEGVCPERAVASPPLDILASFYWHQMYWAVMNFKKTSCGPPRLTELTSGGTVFKHSST